MSGNKALDSWGTHQLIPYSNLTYNNKTNTEYLQNDCLRLIVKEIVVYSTPHCKRFQFGKAINLQIFLSLL